MDDLNLQHPISGIRACGPSAHDRTFWEPAGEAPGADAVRVWLTQTRRKETRLPHPRARKVVFQEEKKYPRPLRVLSSRRKGLDQNEENVTPGM